MGPFFKWAGGKRRLAERICSLLPSPITVYVEPFLGAGAVFWRLLNDGRLNDARIILADVNEELINAWKMVRDQPQALISLLREMQSRSSASPEAQYYAVRALDPERLSPTEQAARFLYLNATGFNGLYRLNRDGRFNVPYGDRAFAVDAPRLLACSHGLQRADLIVASFDAALLSHAAPGTVAYCDPPYLPLKKEGFTAYTAADFGLDDHRRLLQTLTVLRERGGRAILSNANTPTTAQLYAHERVLEISASRSIGATSPDKAARELLVVF